MVEYGKISYGGAYAKRRTVELFKITSRRGDVQLRARHSGQIGNFVNINNGVSHGGPLSAQLFIIYPDYATKSYTCDIRNANISSVQNTIREDNTDRKWAKRTLELKTKIVLAIYLRGLLLRSL